MTDPLRAAISQLPAPGASPTTIVFRQHTASVALTCDLPTALTAATSTLYSYTTHPAGPAAWQIVIVAEPPTNPAAWDCAFAGTITRDIGPNVSARKLALFGLDVWWIPDRSSLIRLDPRRRLILVNCPPDAARDWSTRLTRQAMTAQLLRQGVVYAHAAAFIYRGQGIAVAGLKGAGKTTTLIAALRHLGADFVTNDRLLLHTDGKTLVGHAWPHRLHIGAGTLHAYSDFTALAATSDTKATVEPPDIPGLLTSGSIRNACHLTVMLWPTLTLDQPTPGAAEPVEPEEVRATLIGTRFFTVDRARGYAARINHWLIPQPESDRNAHIRAAAEAVANTVPCFRLPVGPSPAGTAAGLAEVIWRATG
ncbi:hypothetical protein GCM10022225_27440 [Plantactinospora mayteni]|uniref:Serine kinase n=1 Tax=Plantactinospora mayteni TaxID=566021 RepID=A0ABQ4EIF9_9ACTN|nr:hypothetical protein [Plantactinospora mayteni]GIG94526.1 hypothetical protein Pma05_10990 [Plantactinospora mayteni]